MILQGDRAGPSQDVAFAALKAALCSAPVLLIAISLTVRPGEDDYELQLTEQARINPARPVRDLSPSDTDRLQRAVRSAVAAATRSGGVHTLRIMKFRKPGGICPRDGVPMTHATIANRTTWWCPHDQAV